MNLDIRRTDLIETTDAGSGVSLAELREGYEYMNNVWSVYGKQFITFLQNVGISGNMLDVGCGNGFVACKILQAIAAVKSITAIDISSVAIDMATKQNQDGLTVLMGSVYILPFRENEFDAVLLFDILHHLENPAEALKEVGSVLKTGGKVIIFDLARIKRAWNVVSFGQANGKGKQEGKLGDVQKSVLRGYTLIEITELLKEIGFRRIKVQLWKDLFNVVIAEI